MSHRDITVADLIGNIVVLIGLAIGGAFLLDKLWFWLGWQPFALCAIGDFVDLVLGRTVGLLLICLGLIVWVISGMRQGGYLALAIGGMFIYGFPTWFAAALGARCTP